MKSDQSQLLDHAHKTTNSFGRDLEGTIDADGVERDAKLDNREAGERRSERSAAAIADEACLTTEHVCDDTSDPQRTIPAATDDAVLAGTQTHRGISATPFTRPAARAS